MTDRDKVIAEMRQIEADLAAFKEAHACMHRRAMEMEGTERFHTFKEWPVYAIVDNSLVLGIVRCEGLLEDYRRILADMDTPDNVVTLETVKC
jgi:hypothetical protein